MSIYKWYQEQVLQNRLKSNTHQLQLIKSYDDFLSQRKFFLFKKSLLQFGFYIYGSFGCGKSMLLNIFFEQLPTHKKMRIHFHEFMHQFHDILSNPKITIEKYCNQLKKTCDYLFLDEFHVSDIATAMLIYKILSGIFENHIVVITTSNFHPDNLYQDGLMRDRFLPAINLLKNKLQLHHLEQMGDYRKNNSQLSDNFIVKCPNSLIKLNMKFSQYSKGGVFNNGDIVIQHRYIPYIKKSNNTIWFDFIVICGDLRSQLDYIELAQLFDYFIISNIYQLNVTDKNIARRFTWLIDILYDTSKKLIISTNVSLDNIYLEGEFSHEFKRTISRLHEMHTDKYLHKPTKNILWET